MSTENAPANERPTGILIGVVLLGILDLARWPLLGIEEGSSDKGWVIRLIIGVVATLPLVVFVYRAQRALPGLGASRLRFSPVTAAGVFLFPVVRWIVPMFVVREIWRSSASDEAETKELPGVVVAWSALWAVSSTIRGIELMGGSFKMTLALSFLFGYPCDIARIVLTVLLIRSVARRQGATRRRTALLTPTAVAMRTPAAAPATSRSLQRVVIIAGITIGAIWVLFTVISHAMRL
jgi:hypothetical protein